MSLKDCSPSDLILYMVRHHETSLTKEISSFLAPSHRQSPWPCLALPLSSSTRTSPVSQVRTIFFTILSMATKSFFITKSIVILKEWKENQKTRSVSIIGGKAATFWKFLRPSNRKQSIFLAVLLYNIISIWRRADLQEYNQADDYSQLNNLQVIFRKVFRVLAGSFLIFFIFS